MQPYFDSFADFLAMGEHATYVWSCWGISVAVIVGLIVFNIRQRQQIISQIRTQQARRNKQRQQR